MMILIRCVSVPFVKRLHSMRMHCYVISVKWYLHKSANILYWIIVCFEQACRSRVSFVLESWNRRIGMRIRITPWVKCVRSSTVEAITKNKSPRYGCWRIKKLYSTFQTRQKSPICTENGLDSSIGNLGIQSQVLAYARSILTLN